MSNYAVMTKTRYDEVKGDLVHGIRYSLDGLWVVAKLAQGQTVEHASIQTHEEAAQTMQGPEWSPPVPEEESS